MTPEQKREQLLKRVLPGMAITVIYFVFISSIMSDKMHKAEEEYQGMVRKGVSAAALPGVMSQSSQLQQQIAELKRQQNGYREKLKTLAGFLSNAAPSNDSTALLSAIMDSNGMRTLEEKRETYPEADLGASLKEVWLWLKPPEEADAKTQADAKAKPATGTINVQHLWLKGSYQAMYGAMAAIADSELQAVPVIFTMHTPDDENAPPGELEWELILWM
ncbi:MAG: hypothetical protein ACU83N_17090 [Gammaproteobacteria bacterium]